MPALEVPAIMPAQEAIHRPLPGPAEIVSRTSRHNIVNGFIALLFAVTGPLVILLSVGRNGGLSADDISSWIFAAYAVGGALTVVYSLLYRQPIAIMWTIPGAVLVGASMNHLSFPEIIGAYLASGVLILVLGLTGTVGRIMGAIPLPIVMGMVAGVFLPFGIAMVDAFGTAPTIAGVMLLTFLVVSRIAALARLLPPVLAALLTGAAALAFGDTFTFERPLTFAFASPNLYWPVFSWQAIAELTVPLAVTVIGIQNAQGFVILQQVGYRPPQNALTTACGYGSLVFGILGSVPTCVTGPSNAILNTSGPKEDRYISGMVFGILAIAFGVSAPFMTALGLALPTAFIAMLGGLAMLAVLQGAFVSAFRGDFTLGALTAFIVTMSGMTLLNVGAPFWGLVFGYLVSRLLEPDAFRKLRDAAEG